MVNFLTDFPSINHIFTVDVKSSSYAINFTAGLILYPCHLYFGDILRQLRTKNLQGFYPCHIRYSRKVLTGS